MRHGQRYDRDVVNRPSLHPALLLSFLLLMQSVLAPVHCLLHAVTTGFETVICTPEGTRSVLVTADGDPAPQGHLNLAFCPICHSLPAAPALAVPALPIPAWTMASIAWHATARDSLPPAARAPPFHSTGPPLSLS